jgi:DivIVA domain-containing protein
MDDSTSPTFWPTPRRGLVMGLGAGLLFDVVCLWMVREATQPGWETASPSPVAAGVVGALGLAFFGPITLLILVRLVLGGGVRLTVDGVEARTTVGRAFLPWQDVETVRLEPISSVWILTLVPRPGHTARVSWGHRLLGRVSSRFGHQEGIYVNQTMVDDIEGLHEAIRRRLGLPDAPAVAAERDADPRLVAGQPATTTEESPETLVAGAHFGRTRLHEGYSIADVDRFLEQLSSSLRRDPPPETARQVRNARFTPVRIVEGYRMDDVDAFLSEVTHTLAARHRGR